MGHGPSRPRGRPPAALTERWLVTVYTGTHAESGVDSDVHFVVIGESGACPPQALARPAEGDHAKPHAEVIEMAAAADFGHLGAVELVNRGTGPRADLQVYKIVVDKVMHRGVRVAPGAGQRWVFPAYGWVGAGSSRLFFEGKAYVPQATPPWLQKYREAELARNKETYGWGFNLGMPAGIQAKTVAELPRDERPPARACVDPLLAAASTLAARRINRQLEKHHAWDAVGEDDTASSLHNELFLTGMYSKEANSFDPAKRKLYLNTDWKVSVRGREMWVDDAEFGRQATQGAHPVLLRALQAKDGLPEGFAVPELTQLLGKGTSAATQLQRVLRLGQTVASEVPNGRVFILDYRLMANFLPDSSSGAKGQTVAAAPVCLLYACDGIAGSGSREKILYPVAIKIDPADPSAPVFTPNDALWDWHTAKLFVANADAQYHLMVSRYLETQATIEPFAVSAARNLSPMHPVSKLLRPHLKYNIAANVLFREKFLAADGAYDVLFSLRKDQLLDLAAAAYDRWTFESLSHPVSMVLRGFDGREKLETYPLRDDGALVWGAITDYVTDYLSLYYGPKGVESDPEFQAWYKEAFELGHAGQHYAQQATCQQAEAVAVLSSIIWACSGLHSCLSQLYQAYGFAPWRPCILHTPPPAAKGTCSPLTFLLTIPTRSESAMHAAFFYNTTADLAPLAPGGGGEGTSFLNERNEVWLTDVPAVEAFRRFVGALSEIDNIIMVRNQARGRPSYHLLSCNIVANTF